MRLFKHDSYAIIVADDIEIDLSGIDEKTSRRLAIQFNVMLTASHQPDQGEMTLFNLNESTRNAISGADSLKVFLHSGYTEPLPVIAQGDVNTTISELHSTEWRTLLRFGDGDLAYQTARYTRSIRKGTPIVDVVQDIISSMDLSVSDIGDLLTGKTTPGGLALDGKASDALTQILGDNDIEWTINKDTIEFSHSDSIIEITPESGLLSFPIKTDKGISFVSQINKSLVPGQRVDIDGVYTIIKAIYSGDNFGGLYEVKCEAIRADDS